MSKTSKYASFIVRKANVSDTVQVLQMIKDLAEFKNMTHKVTIDQNSLEQEFSKNSSSFQCVVVETSKGILTGFAIYGQMYCTREGWTVYIDTLYVKPENRLQGLGKKLLKAVMKDAYAAEWKKAYLYVLSWNPALEFYTKLGAVSETEIDKYQLFELNQEMFTKCCN